MKTLTATLAATAQALVLSLATGMPANASTVDPQESAFAYMSRPGSHGESSHRRFDPSGSLANPMPQGEDGDAVYEAVELVSGRNFMTDMFYIETGGTYLATLTDLVFPTRLGQLGMSVATPTERLGMTLGAGSFVFDALPGSYYLSLFANTNNRYSLGQYGVRIALADSTSPVPLPPALWLFASGLLALSRLPGRRSCAKV